MDIASAIRDRQLISFTYGGFQRTVEPHTLGIDSKGHEALCGYQVSGGSKSGDAVGWKTFRVNEMRDMTVLTSRHFRARPDYVQGDAAFRVIHAEL